MATKAARYCTGSPTCSNLQGQCAVHGTPAQRSDKARGSASARGYDSTWASTAAAFRASHPVCGERADGKYYKEHSMCLQAGITRAAQVVDHIIPLPHGSRLDPRNHQSLCRRCNAAKVAHDVKAGLPENRVKVEDGWVPI